MKVTKTVGFGIGAIVAALASCHIIQAAVLGMLGGLGVLTLLEGRGPAVIVAVFGCGALAVYGVIRLWRARQAQVGPEGVHVR